MTDDNNLSNTYSSGSKIQNVLYNNVYCSVFRSGLSVTDLVGQSSSGRVCLCGGWGAVICVVAESPSGPHPVIWKMRTALCVSVAYCFVYCSRLYLFL